MAKHVQRNDTLTDVTERTGGEFSRMKGIIELFSNKAPNVANLKDPTATEILTTPTYARETYLRVILLLSCDWIIYGNLVEYMGNIYAMG